MQCWTWRWTRRCNSALRLGISDIKTPQGTKARNVCYLASGTLDTLEGLKAEPVLPVAPDRLFMAYGTVSEPSRVKAKKRGTPGARQNEKALPWQGQYLLCRQAGHSVISSISVRCSVPVLASAQSIQATAAPLNVLMARVAQCRQVLVRKRVQQSPESIGGWRESTSNVRSKVGPWQRSPIACFTRHYRLLIHDTLPNQRRRYTTALPLSDRDVLPINPASI